MPKKSNEFQRLVYLLQRASSPLGASVTESALELDGTTREPREIDVCIKCHGENDVHFRIAVEAKDEKRPMSLERFDAFLGKYLVPGGVTVDKLVVVTKAGFTPRVEERARLLNREGKHPPIDLIKMTDALKPSTWGNCFPDSTTMRFSLPTEMHLTGTRPPLPGHSLAGIVRGKSMIIDEATGHRVSLELFISQHLYPLLLRTKSKQIALLRDRASRSGRTEETPFTCEMVPPALLAHCGRWDRIHGFEGVLRQPTDRHRMKFTRKSIIDVLTGKQRRFAVAEIKSDSLDWQMTFPHGPDSEFAQFEFRKPFMVRLSCSTTKMSAGDRPSGRE